MQNHSSLFPMTLLFSNLLNCFFLSRRLNKPFLTNSVFSDVSSSGWIPDGRGGWVKDENVEFDSDEEEPPDLPLD